jgi:hypothetical protein
VLYASTSEARAHDVWLPSVAQVCFVDTWLPQRRL